MACSDMYPQFPRLTPEFCGLQASRYPQVVEFPQAQSLVSYFLVYFQHVGFRLVQREVRGAPLLGLTRSPTCSLSVRGRGAPSHSVEGAS